MNSTKLKAIFLGMSCFAIASTFAQDTSKMPKRDTTKWPKHDSTSMSGATHHSNLASRDATMLNSFFTKNEALVALKTEAEDEILTKKFFIKISS